MAGRGLVLLAMIGVMGAAQACRFTIDTKEDDHGRVTPTCVLDCAGDDSMASHIMPGFKVWYTDESLKEKNLMVCFKVGQDNGCVVSAEADVDFGDGDCVEVEQKLPEPKWAEWEEIESCDATFCGQSGAMEWERHCEGAREDAVCVGGDGYYQMEFRECTAPQDGCKNSPYFDEEIGGKTMLMTKDTHTYDEGMKFCKSKGGILARVDSKELKDAIAAAMGDRNSAKDRVWIGVNDITKENTWKYTGVNSYDDGDVGYTNWGKNEPNDAGGKEDCVQMRPDQGVWNDDQCSKEFRVLCEQVKDPYKPIGGKLLLLSKDLKTYEEGKKFCNDNYGGVMVRVTSLEMNDAIAEFMGDSTDNIWTGLNDRTEEGTWKYNDDEIDDAVYVDVSYVNWDENEPNDHQGAEDCVAMRADKKYKWNDFPCADTYRVLCEREELFYDVSPFESR